MRFKTVLSALILLSISTTSLLAQNQNTEVLKTKGTNYAHLPNTILKKESDSLVVHVRGKGITPVVLITGHMQDEGIYKNFISRNIDIAQFHVVIPPGMGGTPAYPWPGKNEVFIGRPWSSKFEKELITYIDKNIKDKSYLVVSWFFGLSTALQLAEEYPEKIGGIMAVGPIERAPYGRLYNPNMQESDVLYDIEAQRNALKRYITFWRTVDEFTWHSNMFPPEFYSNDRALGQIIVYQEAKQPYPINLRYFAEYLSEDISNIILNLEVPLQVITVLPDKNLLQSMLKGSPFEGKEESYIEPMKKIALRDWQLNLNKNISHIFLEGSGLIAWEDKPGEFDQIFMKFISNN